MFRGQFKFNSSQGNKYTYTKGDVVIYEGKLYQSKATTKKSPLQYPSNWTFLNVGEPYRGTYPPANAKENQIWINDDGNKYIYFYDGDTYQWISI